MFHWLYILPHLLFDRPATEPVQKTTGVFQRIRSIVGVFEGGVAIPGKTIWTRVVFPDYRGLVTVTTG